MIAAVFLYITVGLFCQINGLDTDHWGTYFVTSFIRNSPGADYMIIVTTREVSHVIITHHGSGYTNHVTIEGNKSHVEVFNDTVIPMSSLEVIESMAISVESSVKVSVYGFSNFLRSSDGFLVLPVSTLGTEYLAINYDQGFPQILVAAVENNTVVDVELNSPNICFYNSTSQLFDVGQVFSFQMNEFDLLPVYCARDCTGMKITANQPIAALSGNLCVKIPTASVCDHITEMLTPTSEFGTQFMIVSPIGQDYISLFRVLAMENETIIFIGNANFTIDAYRHITFGAPVGVNQCLNTTKPVLVAQYMTGRTTTTQSENYTGDAYMVLIPPVGRYPTNYVIDTSFLHDDVISYMITIFDMDDVCGDYSYTVNEIVGIHSHSSTNSMGVIIYGVDFREGYAYLAGLKLTSFSGHVTCIKKPCKNGGWCLELSSGYKCRCLKGFTGTQCEIADESHQVQEVNSEIYSKTSNTLSISSTTTLPTTEQLSDLILNPASLVSSMLSITAFQTIIESTMELSSSRRDSYGMSISSEGEYTMYSLILTQSAWSSYVSDDVDIFKKSTVFQIPETEILQASELLNEQSLSQLLHDDLESAESYTLETSQLNLMPSVIPFTEPESSQSSILETSQLALKPSSIQLTEPGSFTIGPTPSFTTAYTDHPGHYQTASRLVTVTPSISTSTPSEMLFSTKRCNGHTCQCSCPCSRYFKQNNTQSYIENNLIWLKVDKNTVSKIYYLKNSAKNRRESERDLGVVSVLFVISITAVIIVLDMTSCVKIKYPQRRRFGR